MDDPFDMTPPTGMYSLEVLNAALMRISSQRSEEHTSELQSQPNLVCRLLLEKKQPLDQARGAVDPRPPPVHRRRQLPHHPPPPPPDGALAHPLPDHPGIVPPHPPAQPARLG